MKTQKHTAPILSLTLICALGALFVGCRKVHKDHTGGDEKPLYPSEKAKKPGTDEGIPTPGGAAGGAAGSQSSTEKKSNPKNPEEPTSR